MRGLGVLLAVGLIAAVAVAADAPEPAVVPVQAKTGAPPPAKKDAPPAAKAAPRRAPSATSSPRPRRWAQPASQFDQAMLGDLPPSAVNVVPTGPVAVATPLGTPAAPRPRALVPLAAANFKVGENESPRPVDRVYLSVNQFEDLNGALNRGFLPRVNLTRETLGVEKTFLAGDASVGLRLPFVQVTGSPTVEQAAVSDLSVIFKYAWINDRETGNVFSTGLVLTLPTGNGGRPELSDGTRLAHTAIVQPWLGGIYRLTPDVYAIGFSSLAVPTAMPSRTCGSTASASATSSTGRSSGGCRWCCRCSSATSARRCGTRTPTTRTTFRTKST